MNILHIYTLKALQKLYAKVFSLKPSARPECELDADVASRIIYDKLMDDKPCMIARFGSNELLCMVTYLGIKEGNNNILSYIRGKTKAWWWNETNLDNMHYVAGFYPKEYSAIESFCELMINDLDYVDVLGSWLTNENYFENELINTKKIWLDFLNPFFSISPWSKALENKKILVVHPFSETIIKQYLKRELLFKDQNVLPRFELKTIKAVQSYAKNSTQFANWFEALDYMKAEIDKHDYEICLIGAGAYGFPLAAHVKRQGKKAVHLGGSLQLLFGIRGKRWEDPSLNKDYCFADFMNEHWVRPSEDEKPAHADKVEGACYW